MNESFVYYVFQFLFIALIIHILLYIIFSFFTRNSSTKSNRRTHKVLIISVISVLFSSLIAYTIFVESLSYLFNKPPYLDYVLATLIYVLVPSIILYNYLDSDSKNSAKTNLRIIILFYLAMSFIFALFIHWTKDDIRLEYEQQYWSESKWAEWQREKEESKADAAHQKEDMYP